MQATESARAAPTGGAYPYPSCRPRALLAVCPNEGGPPGEGGRRKRWRVGGGSAALLGVLAVAGAAFAAPAWQPFFLAVLAALLFGSEATIAGLWSRDRQDTQGLRAASPGFESLRAAFEADDDGIVICNGPLIEAVNPAFCQLLGQSAGELRGRPLAALGEWLVDVGPRLPGEAAEGGASAGRYVVHVARRRVLHHSDRPTPGGSVHRFRDVGDELDRLWRENEFRTRAARELRLPLAGVLGFSELLLHEEYDLGTRQEMIAAIHRCSQETAEVVGSLFDRGDPASASAADGLDGISSGRRG